MGQHDTYKLFRKKKLIGNNRNVQRINDRFSLNLTISLKPIETKHMYMHIFVCRSITKITYSSVFKLKLYTLPNGKNINAYYLIYWERIYIVDYCIIKFSDKIMFFFIYWKMTWMFFFLHSFIRRFGLTDGISKGGKPRMSMFLFPI